MIQTDLHHLTTARQLCTSLYVIFLFMSLSSDAVYLVHAAPQTMMRLFVILLRFDHSSPVHHNRQWHERNGCNTICLHLIVTIFNRADSLMVDMAALQDYNSLTKNCTLLACSPLWPTSLPSQISTSLHGTCTSARWESRLWAHPVMYDSLLIVCSFFYQG